MVAVTAVSLQVKLSQKMPGAAAEMNAEVCSGVQVDETMAVATMTAAAMVEEVTSVAGVAQEPAMTAGMAAAHAPTGLAAMALSAVAAVPLAPHFQQAELFLAASHLKDNLPPPAEEAACPLEQTVLEATGAVDKLRIHKAFHLATSAQATLAALSIEEVIRGTRLVWFLHAPTHLIKSIRATLLVSHPSRRFSRRQHEGRRG